MSRVPSANLSSAELERLSPEQWRIKRDADELLRNNKTLPPSLRRETVQNARRQVIEVEPPKRPSPPSARPLTQPLLSPEVAAQLTAPKSDDLPQRNARAPHLAAVNDNKRKPTPETDPAYFKKPAKIPPANGVGMASYPHEFKERVVAYAVDNNAKDAAAAFDLAESQVYGWARDLGVPFGTSRRVVDAKERARIIADARQHGIAKACELHKVSDATVRRYLSAEPEPPPVVEKKPPPPQAPRVDAPVPEPPKPPPPPPPPIAAGPSRDTIALGEMSRELTRERARVEALSAKLAAQDDELRALRSGAIAKDAVLAELKNTNAQLQGQLTAMTSIVNNLTTGAPAPRRKARK